MMNSPPPDALKKAHIRCPRLGGPISFSYCRESGEDGRPCWKIITCWWEIFDVVSFLRHSMDSESFAALSHARPKPKVESLVELIDKARKNIHLKKRTDSEEA